MYFCRVLLNQFKFAPYLNLVIDGLHSVNRDRIPSYAYWNITGDICTVTFKVGDTGIHDRGHLFALDLPSVKAIAAKYPGRSGLKQVPISY